MKIFLVVDVCDNFLGLILLVFFICVCLLPFWVFCLLLVISFEFRFAIVAKVYVTIDSRCLQDPCKLFMQIRANPFSLVFDVFSFFQCSVFGTCVGTFTSVWYQISLYMHDYATFLS